MLDIFFEALNYEKIEQKKAYEVAGLLGRIIQRREILRGSDIKTSRVSFMFCPAVIFSVFSLR